ncbi:MAG: hypothetical protein IH852_08560 [Bacteroidetes bacterium]|nr:hypothetical protein [Bacteroidota bacterium]
MGQQQLLLVLLGIVVVGVAIVVAINLFRGNAIDRKREILINESHNIGSIAIAFYKKPRMMGGGGKRFTGWTIPSSLVATVNGSYTAQVSPDNIVIIGTGTEVVTDNDSIKVQTVVTADAINSIIIN